MSRGRRLGALVLFASSMALFALGWATPGSAADAPIPVALKGEGSWGPYQQIVTWQDQLYADDAPIDLAYTSTGSYLARQDFLTGSLDYAISALPFTDEEIAQYQGGRANLIDVPISVESLGMLLATPVPEGFESIELVCDPYDPETPDPDACIVRKPYTGPIRVPNEQLAAMIFKYAGTGAIPISSWNAPETLEAMGVPNFSLPEQASPAPVMRSEPTETNYFLQLFAQQAAPTTWAGLKASDANITWEPITERLPRIAGASRQGVDQQSLQLGLIGADPASGGITGFTKGILAPVPASAKQVVNEAFPNTPLTFLEVQNASGEWVAPTPESISKAVEAGGDQPLYALKNAAPGAYPFVWVNHLYAPASGLTVDETEALATVIRYLATDGQDAAAPVGEGRLSPALVQQALEGADDLVRSNCKGDGAKLVESTAPGRFTPDLPKVKAIGRALHCEVAPGATTTTATTTTIANTIPEVPVETVPPFDPGAFDPGTFDPTFDDGAGAGAEVPADVTTTAPPPTTTTTAAPAEEELPVVALPLGLPDGKPKGYDQFAALLLGASGQLALGPTLRRLLLLVIP